MIKNKIKPLMLATTLMLTSVTPLIPASVNGETLLTPPVLYYNFDHGTVIDESGNDNDGTAQGPVEAKGIKESSMLFDGNDKIIVGNDSSLNFGTGDFSIAFWVKATPGTNGVIIDKRDTVSRIGYSLEIFNGVPLLQIVDDNRGYFNYYKLGNDSCINDGAWHFVAVTVDRDSSTGVKIYVDENLITSQNALYRTGNISNSSSLCIGQKRSGSQYLKASLDELRIYDRVISQAELVNLYTDYFKIAHWTFDNNANDISGNGNSALNVSPSFVNGVSGKCVYFNGSNLPITIPDNPTLDIDLRQNRTDKEFSYSFWIKKQEGTNQLENIFNKFDDLNNKGYKLEISNGQNDKKINAYFGSVTGSSYTTYGLWANSIDFSSFPIRPSGACFTDEQFPQNPLTDSKWHHMVLTMKYSHITLYIDGLPYSYFSTSARPYIKELVSDVDLLIGGQSFKGYLDELIIYTKDLTDSEVYDLYNSY